MTCYILFLFIYPWLNRLIAVVDQRQMLRIVSFLSFIWIGVNYFLNEWFYPSNLILWITIYFLIAYLKLYCTHAMTSLKVGKTLLALGIAGYIAQVVVTNYVGLYWFNTFFNKVLWWHSSCCPFYIMIAIGSIIIALQAEFKSPFVNYVSGLSMLIYLIHENKLFRTYTRPVIWQCLYVKYGHSHIVLQDLVFAFVLFLVSAIISAIYKETVQRLVAKISSKLYVLVSRFYARLECIILKLR